MRPEPCPQRLDAIGALAVGRLAAPDEAELRAHAAGCEGCAAEIEALVPVARLLAYADADHAEAPTVALPAGHLPRLEVRMGAERRSRSRRRWLGAGAAAAVATAALVLALPIGDRARDQIRFDTGDPDVALTATLTPATSGTEVELYVRGIEEGTRCRVWLRDDEGRREPAGSFIYRYGHEADSAALAAAIDRPSVEAIEVRAGRKTFEAPAG